jgi:hypothetical protein
MGFGKWPLALAAALTTASFAAQDPDSEPVDAETLRVRDRTAILDLRTVVMAGRAYAAVNGGLFGTLSCCTQPETCRPDFPKDAAPFLDPSHDWLAIRLGYARTFHPGPPASEEEIQRAKAAPGSLKSFAFTVAPVKPGQTGLRAFCGDSTGRICVSRDGSEPPVKDGRCAKSCPELK